jgi:hypothetical protein
MKQIFSIFQLAIFFVFTSSIFATPHLLFNGKSLTLINEKGVAIQSWPAGAGRPFTSPKDQVLKNKGPLPEGNYAVQLKQTIFFKNPTGFHSKLSWMKNYIAWGNLAIPLEAHPTNTMFGRDSFMIHGGGWIIGSKGCIYVFGNDTQLFNQLRTLPKSVCILKVSYAPTH